MKNLVTLTSLLLLLAASGQAQDYILQSNLVKAGVSTNGTMFENGQFIPQGTELPETSLIKGAGLWIAGLDPGGNLRGAVNRLNTTDFQPGVLSRLTNQPEGNLHRVWAVKCSEIATHLADYADNGVIDMPQSAIYSFPCKGNYFFSQYNAPDAFLPFTSQTFCGYFDQSEDAQYDPNHGEYPVVEIRGCPLQLRVAELAYTASNDVLATSHPSGMQAIGLEVQTQVFQVNTPTLDKTVFVRYKLIYQGEVPLDSCFVGIYTDFAIGNDQDDYIGTQPASQLMYAYNGDEQDENVLEGQTPAVGVTLLRGPLSPISDIASVELGLQSALAVPDPSGMSPSELYNLLKGRLPDGTASPVGAFAFPGNPANNEPGTEIALGNTPGKRRGLMTMGPFVLNSGAANEIIVAYHYDYVPGATHYEQTLGPQEITQAIRNAFDNCLQDVKSECSDLTEAPEEFVETGWNLFPNPANSEATLLSKNASFSRIVVTDVLGRTVKELKWEKPVAQYSIPLGDLPSGVYTVQANKQTLPLVIQR